MNTIVRILLLAAMSLAAELDAASTINATNKYAWGANIGWTNWLPSAADGVVVGEYVCSGYVWAANVGWIGFGSGNPVNHIQYQNNSPTDFGVNYSIDPSQPGIAILRGYAYGANIGWINFEATGNPRVSLFTGTFSGYAYSANCGWINLNDVNGKVQTDHVLMGVDSDADGIADAFEYQYFGNLTTANMSTDNDHDGISDEEEYLDGTSPIISTDRLHITAFGKNASDSTKNDITWTSSAARFVRNRDQARPIRPHVGSGPDLGRTICPRHERRYHHQNCHTERQQEILPRPSDSASAVAKVES